METRSNRPSKGILCSVGALALIPAGSFLAPGLLDAAPFVGVVKGTEVKIRTGGSQNHHSFSTLRNGQRIIVDREINGWCKIHIPRWIPVYVHKDYLNVSAAKGVVKAGELNIRVVPQRAHEVVGTLPMGSEVEVLGKEGDWLRVAPPTTAFAYIHQRYVVKDRDISPSDVGRQLALITSDAVSTTTPPGKSGGPGAKTASLTSTPSITPALRRAEEMLTRLSAEDPLKRDYTMVKALFEGVVTSSEDRAEISAAEAGLKRIGQLEQSQAALIAAHRSIAETERRNQEVDAQARQARATGRGAFRSVDSDPYLARGWLTGMSRFNGHPGTHRLMKGSQVLYLLQSEDGRTIPLDAYLGRRVGVKGVIKELEPRFGANLIVVSEISVLSDR